MRTRIFKFIVGLIVAVSGFGLITMFLWNILMPGIFGIITINFWQAIGLLVLARVMFSGIGGGHFMHMGGMMAGRKNFIREKWMKMTPEERRKFLHRHHRHHHHGGFFDTEEFVDTDKYADTDKHAEKCCEQEDEQS